MRSFGYTVGLAAALTLAAFASVSAQVFGSAPPSRETAGDLPLPSGTFRINNAWTRLEPLRKVAPVGTPEAKIARLERTAILTGIIAAFGVLPAGAGISPDAIEEGQTVGAAERPAFAPRDFEIDERGVPGGFEATEASADVSGGEAIRLLRLWRFNPAIDKGPALPPGPREIHAREGPRELTASLEAEQLFIERHPSDSAQRQPARGSRRRRGWQIRTVLACGA